MSKLRFVLGLTLAGIAGCMGVSAYAAGDTHAGEVEINGVYYATHQGVNGKEAYVSWINSEAKEVVVPTSIEVGSETFIVTSLKVESNLMKHVFTSLTLPPTLKSISFPRCYKELAYSFPLTLKEVHISDIAAWCGIVYFYNSQIEYEYGDQNPLSTGATLYLNDEKIENLVIPEGVEKIESYAFYGNSSIKTVKFPSTLKEIGYQSFTSNITPYEAFYVPSLEVWNSITLTVKELFNNSHGDPSKLISYPLQFTKSLYIDDKLLTTLQFPDDVEKINNYAFDNFSGLSSVTITPQIKDVGAAFSNCPNLRTLRFAEGLTNIDIQGYGTLPALKWLFFPESLNEITKPGFMFNDSPLEAISVGAMTPPTIPSNLFSIKQYVNTTLHVPVGTKDLYINAPYWGNFVHIVESASGVDGIEEGTKHPFTISDNTVTFLDDSQLVEIYSLDGKMLYSAVGGSVSLPSGIYMLRVGTNSIKIIL